MACHGDGADAPDLDQLESLALAAEASDERTVSHHAQFEHRLDSEFTASRKSTSYFAVVAPRLGDSLSASDYAEPPASPQAKGKASDQKKADKMAVQHKRATKKADKKAAQHKRATKKADKNAAHHKQAGKKADKKANKKAARHAQATKKAGKNADKKANKKADKKANKKADKKADKSESPKAPQLDDLLVDYLETSENTLPTVPDHTASLSLPNGHVEAKTVQGITKAACNSFCNEDSQCTGFKFTLKPEGKSEAECVTLEKKARSKDDTDGSKTKEEKTEKEKAEDVAGPKAEIKKNQAVKAGEQFKAEAEQQLADLSRLAGLSSNSTISTEGKKQRMMDVNSKLSDDRDAKKSYQRKLKQVQRDAKGGSVTSSAVAALSTEFKAVTQKEIALKEKVKAELKKKNSKGD